MIHYIYCYTNKANGKQYIGQTNNLSRRKKQHIQDSFYIYSGKEVSYELPFHRAIRKYGIDGFDFEVLRVIDTEDWSIVNKIESECIREHNSMSPNGYNLQAQRFANPGKNKTKLTDEEVEGVIKDLKEGVFIPDIAQKYQLSRSYISDINNGRCLRRQDETYPLQQNRMTNDEYYEIIDLIKNTNYSLREIARKTGRHRDTIEKINKGYSKIIRTLYDGKFPIRENARQGYTLKPVETISGETESRDASGK